jgi:AbrB family looped-hinge helix DNA binding protein
MSVSRATVKGHVVIPVELRKKFNIRKGSLVSISEGEGGVMILKPLPDDPIEHARGMLKGGPSLTKALLKSRREEKERE